MKEKWDQFVKFLTEYDAHKIAEVLRNLKWSELFGSPLFWLVTIILLTLIVWKKQFKLILLAVSFVVFMILLQHTLPESGKPMSLTDLLQFVGGCMALVGVNAYYLFIRQ